MEFVRVVHRSGEVVRGILSGYAQDGVYVLQERQPGESALALFCAYPDVDRIEFS